MQTRYLLCTALVFSALTRAHPINAAEQVTIQESDTRVISGYLFNNNVWGKEKSPQGWQLVDVEAANGKFSWTIRYNWPAGLDPHAVKCYPSAVNGWQWGTWSTDGQLPVMVSALEKAVSSASTKLTNPGVQNVAYDLWFHDAAPIRSEDKPSDELMIWMGSYGGAGPLGERQGKVEIDGTTWTLYVGDIGWKVFSFIREENTASWNVDMKAFIDHLIAKGLMKPTKQLSSVQFGTEVFATKGDGKLEITDYSVAVAARMDVGAAAASPGAEPSAAADAAVRPETLSKDLAVGAVLTADTAHPSRAAALGKDGDATTWWEAAEGDRAGILTLSLPAPVTFDVVSLREPATGEAGRIETFAVETYDGKSWTTAALGGAGRANRFVRLQAPVTTDKVRIRVGRSRQEPALAEVGLFKQAESDAIPGAPETGK